MRSLRQRCAICACVLERQRRHSPRAILYTPRTPAMAHIAELVVYPVKGCKGVAMQRCAFTAAGLQWDRSWMVVNANGKFVTQVRSL